MVHRKPVSPRPAVSTSQPNQAQLPYPVSPIAPDQPNTSLVDHSSSGGYAGQAGPSWPQQTAQLRPQPSAPSISDEDDEWSDGDSNEPEERETMPPSLKVGHGQPSGAREQGLPASLRAGPPEGTPRTSSESHRSKEAVAKTYGPDIATSQQPSFQTTQTTNPYLRAKSSERKASDFAQAQEESSADIWTELVSTPLPPTSAPPPPPLSAPPPPPLSAPPPPPFPVAETMNSLSLSDNTHTLNAPSNPFDSLVLPPSTGAPFSSSQEARLQGPDTKSSPLAFESLNDTSSDVFEGLSGKSHRDYFTEQSAASEYHELDALSPQIDSVQAVERASVNKDLPAIPQQSLKEDSPVVPPPQPPRPLAQAPTDHSRGALLKSEPETPPVITAKQRGETYQIKHIRWLDYAASNTLRTSPIMVQNANGPCPLLALVNALTLSTPSNVTTALIETLRVREQVSLGLLLDAVFDELMSGRRGDAAQELPDVGELYAFLVTLHTGMNVNPRFVSSTPPNLMDALDSNAPLFNNDHPTPGEFEATKEMKLYSAFSVPLIHGWLPPRSHPAFSALQRSAKTYEDAQNLMFREEELEDKLQQQGLNQAEQLLLEDIASIKYFLSSSATQLTGYGLDIITEALAPGSMAILFRNDHFSTLYKHPQSGQLLTLVTDMGYAGHDEVVWESLVDVNGEGCEFFAGDFRPVGQVAGDTNPPPDDDRSWTTVTRSGRGNGPSKANTVANQRSPATPLDAAAYNLATSSNTEQEDADLALAMQLQEEEEDRSRRESEARRREDQLSQAFLDSEQGPHLTPRRNANPANRGSTGGSTGRSQVVRPLVPPRNNNNSGTTSPRVTPATREPVQRPSDPEAGDDAPPPSYEQAAKSSPYIPPSGQSYPTSPNNPAQGVRPQGGRPRQNSAYNQQRQSMGLPVYSDAQRRNAARMSGPVRGNGAYGGLDHLGGVARRRSSGLGMSEEERRDKDCVIM